MAKEVKFVVAWQSKTSQAHGKLDKPFDKEDAQKECDYMNRLFPDVHYYPSKVETPRAKRQSA